MNRHETLVLAAETGRHGAVAVLALDARPRCVDRDQRRVVIALVGMQVLGGVGVAVGTAVSSLAGAAVSGSAAVGGMALTATVLGAAAASLLLSRVAVRAGRRPALLIGYALGVAGASGAAVGAALASWPLLLVALIPFGAATASGLAARFAATDLAAPERRARTLGTVVWATTVGAVAGPNLADPAQRVADGWRLGVATGPFVVCAASFALAAVVVWAGLRPDPLLVARARRAAPPGEIRGIGEGASWRALLATPPARLAVLGIMLCHLVMVGVMSMTPVHMDHGGAGLRLIGLVISLHVAAMFMLSPAFGWLADRAGNPRVLGLAAGLLIAGTTLCAAVGPHDTALLSTGLVLLGLGWSAGLIAGSTLLTASVPVAVRPVAQGLADVTMHASGAVGGLLAGVIVTVGSFGLLAGGAAVLVVPYLLAVAAFTSRAPRSARAAESVGTVGGRAARS